MFITFLQNLELKFPTFEASDSGPSCIHGFCTYTFAVPLYICNWNKAVYPRMHETVNKTLLWGRSVSKCQVSVLQFLEISKLLIPERPTTEHLRTTWLSLQSILGASLPSKQEEALGPTHPLWLLCDISSCPWCRQLTGAATALSTDSPLAGAHQRKEERIQTRNCSCISHYPDASATFPWSQTCLNRHNYLELRILQLNPVKVRS